MRKFKSVMAAFLAIMLVGGGIAAAITYYNMNCTSDGTFTVTESVTNIDVCLASDILGTPFVAPLAFAAVTEGGTPQGAVYFDATKILPSSINVVFNSVSSGTPSFIVGTPSGSTGFCPILMFISGASNGAGTFNFTVTGHS